MLTRVVKLYMIILYKVIFKYEKSQTNYNGTVEKPYKKMVVLSQRKLGLDTYFYYKFEVYNFYPWVFKTKYEVHDFYSIHILM